MAIGYHSGRRGFLGFLTYITGSDGISRGGVIPAYTPTSSAGVEITSFGGDATAANQVIQSAKLDTLHTDLVAATPAGANLIGKVGIDQTTPGTTNGVADYGLYTAGALGTVTTGTYNAFKTDQYANLRASPTLTAAAGADALSNASNGYWPGAASGGSGQNLGAVVLPYTFNGTSWDRLKKPNTTSRLLSSAATTNATSAKASAGDLFKITGNNTTATKRYLKIYNKTSAPTVGTDTPVLTFPLPGSAAFDISITAGFYFSTGIAYAITAAAADADTGAILAGDIECLHLVYA